MRDLTQGTQIAGVAVIPLGQGGVGKRITFLTSPLI